MLYVALLHLEKDAATGVSFPDLPGCFAAADNELDVMRCAQEALALYARDQELPPPRTLEEVLDDDEVSEEIAAGAIVLVVPLLVSARKERFNIMMSGSLVEEIDRVAKIEGTSRSEFLEAAAAARLRGEGVTKKTSSAAARILKSKTVSKTGQSVAASALTRTKSIKETIDKSVAASALTQTVKKSGKASFGKLIRRGKRPSAKRA